MYAIAAGPRGTGAAGLPALVVLLLCAAALLCCAVMLRIRGSASQAFVIAVAVLLPAVTAVGVFSQHLVAGRPVLVFSELSEALELAEAAEKTRAELLERQLLLSLPRAQARGVSAEYERSARESLDAAARWNPAAAGDLPGQGFEEVYDVLNRAADAQSDALRAYILNVESPQQAVGDAASALASEVEMLLSDEVFGAAVRDARSGSIALLRRG